ncbi:hypothetical protein Saso_56220 [Streptomyces asoensis]|uniref:Uncharacterized protein n=1 Tax=Streptomyces asoensis TaxID=249586 RepID=A0ABQ3S773_9ACTN|nr:hypothetical protein GCM10010496_45420 [Streptomyces asoensis]GHI63972.1 hypothetical protein Saso_56220 [Streptomyces asoensis]
MRPRAGWDTRRRRRTDDEVSRGGGASVIGTPEGDAVVRVHTRPGGGVQDVPALVERKRELRAEAGGAVVTTGAERAVSDRTARGVRAPRGVREQGHTDRSRPRRTGTPRPVTVREHRGERNIAGTDQAPSQQPSGRTEGRPAVVLRGRRDG